MWSERKIQILDVAERLFSERGYHATSMRDLAQALEMKGGSLYSHISGKEELLWLILERAAGEFIGTIEPIVERGGEPVARLREAIHAHVRLIAGNLDAATVYFHEWRFLTEPRYSQFLEKRGRYEQLMRELVTQAVADGSFQPVEPKWATLLILSAINWLYYWYDPQGPLSADEIAERFVEMMFQGLLQPVAA